VRRRGADDAQAAIASTRVVAQRVLTRPRIPDPPRLTPMRTPWCPAGMTLPRILALGGLVLVACGGDDDDSGDPNLAEAEQLYADLEADYRSFDRMRGWDLPHAESTTPEHGPFIDIYLNDTLSAALEDGPPFPEGSIVVKDGWSDAEGTELFRIALMRKNAEGWFWADLEPDGTATAAGDDLDRCLECHASGADGLLTF